MQDYISIAKKNGVTLLGEGECQFCGAATSRGVHECVEMFSLGFHFIDYSKISNHIYRFLSVDAHTLQHPEIHGRWNNHFHLTRLHLMFHYKVDWNYGLSPRLSQHLNQYKKRKANEFLIPPKILERGKVTTTDVMRLSTDEMTCQKMIRKWAEDVYQAWHQHHPTVDHIAKSFLSVRKS